MIQTYIHCVHGLEFPVLTVHQPYALMLVEDYDNCRCSDDYLAARKLINDILDMLGGQTDGKEGGNQ